MPKMEMEWSVRVLEGPIRLYRGCFARGDSEEDFKSNYERGRPPHPADLRATVLHMAVSFFEDPAVVRRAASRRPDRIGEYVVTVDLQPDHGVCLASSGGPGHWSVWGRPAQLLGFVTDVERV